jgi:hypothetical protein
MRHERTLRRTKMNAVGASGSSPVSDFRLTSAGDRPVALSIFLFSAQPLIFAGPKWAKGQSRNEAQSAGRK